MTDRQLSGQSQTSGAKVCRNWELRQSPEGVSGTEGMCPFALCSGRAGGMTPRGATAWSGGGLLPPTRQRAGCLGGCDLVCAPTSGTPHLSPR